MATLLEPLTITVTITASDSLDPFIRYWNIYSSFPQELVHAVENGSGGTWTVQLDPGTYYFNVDQSDGSDRGTYSGTINGNPFNGVDINHAVQFTVGAGTPPVGNGETTSPATSTNTWIAIGAISTAVVIGAILLFK